jgi:hypothetical protein
MPRRVLAAGLTVLALIPVACSDRDVVTESYATLAEATAAGAVERGWVPRGLPPSTQDLREAHDTDSNRRWGLFNFAPGEGDHLRKLFSTETPPGQSLTCDIPARIEWWPVLLRGSISPDQLTGAGLSAHRTHDGMNLVVNWKQGRAYYWKEE